MTKIHIRQATPESAAWLQGCFNRNMGWAKPEGYFQHVIEQQGRAELILLVASIDTNFAGHCKLVWQPHYKPFRDAGIPEIQDLNVVPKYRRQGVASALMDKCEALIIEHSPTKIAGIGFGLYGDYGAAQRLYIKRGYVPDGRGMMYHDEPVEPGKVYPVDDDLVLRLTKDLSDPDA